MTRSALVVLSLAFAPVAFAQDEPGEEEAAVGETPSVTPETTPPKRDSKKSRSEVGLDVAQSVGAMNGEGIVRGMGLISFTDVGFLPKYRTGAWRFRFPVDLSHRQTYGFALAELRGKGSARAKLWYKKGDIQLQAGVTGVYRPRWPDPYKPLPDGTLDPSNRRSYLAPSVGLDLGSRPGKHHELALSYAFGAYEYVDDPDYDPIAEPTHLTPGDHLRHSVDLSFTEEQGDFTLYLAVEFDHKTYTNRYARDAGTGLTHALPGGTPANPLQREIDAEPSVELRYQIRDTPVELRAGYGLQIQEDPFQGYYSFLGHHPSARIDVDVKDGLQTTLKFEALLRRYGASSYAEGASHPPLDYGDRRVDRRIKTSLDVAVPFADHWAVVAQGEVLVRRTNFPAYVAGVYPATRQYDIDWNYLDWIATAGVRWEL